MKNELEWMILEGLKDNLKNDDKGKLYHSKEELRKAKHEVTLTEKAIFYFPSYTLNLFDPETFKKRYESSYRAKEGGHELSFTKYGTQKMAALKSSSAEIANTLGTETGEITIKEGTRLPAGTYAVQFERPLTCLDANHPAMIDAYLTPKNGGNTVVLDENKVLEYLGFPSWLSESYLDPKKYNKVIADGYSQLFKKHCQGEAKPRKTKDGQIVNYYRPDTTYDVFQLIKHSLGYLNEWLAHAEMRNTNHVILVNSVLHISDSFFQSNPKMRKKYQELWAKESQSQYDKTLINEINGIYKQATEGKLDFRFEFLEYKDFINGVDLSPKRKEYLKRYFI
jgi:hypothetical protein